MAGIFWILMFTTFCCLIIGLLKPSIFQRLSKKKMTRGKIFWYFFTATIVFFILVGISTPSSPWTPQVADQNELESDTNSKEISEKTGTYGEYRFTISDGDGEMKIARFEPFLANNDNILVWAIREVTSVEFGSDVIGTTKPILETRNDKNLILFTTPSGKYYYLIFKEDNGEIWSFSFWRE